uniref:Uncharacterized protein n=1 Tax=Anguilla anguilla TaxID=7936 RepID=A0A0E9UHC3_ANGAN
MCFFVQYNTFSVERNTLQVRNQRPRTIYQGME